MLEEPEIRALFSAVASGYGSHRPALCEAVVRTAGPILELGMGDTSTLALHAVAEACGRLVASYDHETSWVERYIRLRSDHHRIESVASWDQCPIESIRWSVALVDHAPAKRRKIDIARLADHADVIVVHDTEEAAYGYDHVLSTFKYRLDDRAREPWTTLVSNQIDVSRWSLRMEKLVP